MEVKIELDGEIVSLCRFLLQRKNEPPPMEKKWLNRLSFQSLPTDRLTSAMSTATISR